MREAVDGLRDSLAGRFALRLVELRIVDRSLALSSKLFIAILPVTILSTALVSGKAFGDELVTRFGLTGAGAGAARSLFASPSQVQSGFGVLGLLVLISSVLSFSRALETLYLDCWRLPPSADRALGRRLTWLAGFGVFVTVLSPLRSVVADPLAQRLTAAAGAGALFMWTPYVLLGRRVAWQRLVPTAALTAGSVLAFGVGAAIALPRILTHNTERYGLIGFAFSMVTCLFALAGLVIAAAALGSLIDEERSRRQHPELPQV